MRKSVSLTRKQNVKFGSVSRKEKFLDESHLLASLKLELMPKDLKSGKLQEIKTTINEKMSKL